QYPRAASEGERRLAMRVAARSISDPMMESRGIASMLERSYRDVRDGGLTLDDFRARTRVQRTRLRNLEHVRTILRAWSEYERLIEQLGAIDPAELLARAGAVLGSCDAGARCYANQRSAPCAVAGFY